MTLAEMLREEGMEIGLEKGTRNAFVEIIELGLRGTGNDIPADIHDGLRAADLSVLKEIASQLMVGGGFTSIEEIREYL